nr:MAG TPA: hypothetical protein [Caudoviricetes sp.]DAJ89673.1 MAG TPA: hypothetical protein [Caudoviricetes sp.]
MNRFEVNIHFDVNLWKLCLSGLFFIFLKKFFTSIYLYVILYMWSERQGIFVLGG